MDLNELADEIANINHMNGWDNISASDWSAEESKYKIPAKLALVHSELSEALEAFRAGDLDNFLEEMADTLIRTLDIVEGLTDHLPGGFNAIVMDKLNKNRTRGFRHGGKRV